MSAKNILLCMAAMAMMVGCGEKSGGGDENPKPEPVSVDTALLTDAGVVVNGVKWATRNVDKPGQFSAESEDAGMFYQWNRRVGWNFADRQPTATDGSTAWNTAANHGESWTAVNDPSPEGWRVPTSAEFETLLDMDKVSRTWSSSPAGLTFTDIASGNSVFFRAAGYLGDTSGGINLPTWGRYWSSTAYDSTQYEFSLYVQFIEGGLSALYFQERNYGMCIRPVTSVH